MIFSALHAARGFEQKHLKFLATAEDFDLVCEIGYRMELRQPLTMSQLLLLGIASPATVQRRLRRLCRLNAVLKRKSVSDGRVVELLLAPHVVEAFQRYGELLQMVGTRSAPAGSAVPVPGSRGRRATDRY